MGELTAEEYLKSVKRATAACQKVSKTPHTPESRDRALISCVPAPEMPESLHPKKEWAANLVRWFAHVRQDLTAIDEGEELTESALARRIESGEMPRASEMRARGTAISVLRYFEGRPRELRLSDLAWIFGALTGLDTLLPPEQCVTVQAVSDAVVRQLARLDKADERVPHMVVIATVVDRYFHQ